MDKKRLLELAGLPITESDTSERLIKIAGAKEEVGLRIIYTWVKQDVISLKEFNNLIRVLLGE